MRRIRRINSNASDSRRENITRVFVNRIIDLREVVPVVIVKIVNYLNNYDYPYGSINRGYCDSDNNIWIADGNYGLLFNSTSGERKTFTPNGPNSESVAQMKCINGHLWVASGSITGDVPDNLIVTGKQIGRAHV